MDTYGVEGESELFASLHIHSLGVSALCANIAP